jgi:signal transduction histidine kinase
MMPARTPTGPQTARLPGKFSLLSAGLWVGFALVLGTGVTYLVEQKMLERTTVMSLDYFKNLARFITTKEEFVRLRTAGEYEGFDRLIKESFFTPHVVTIKIYDASGRTIYHSRNAGIVGRSFPDNVPLRKALGGETVVGLSDLAGAEHLSERQAGYARLFEVYIPIFLEGTSKVIGAYEIYSPIDPFYQKIWGLRLAVWAAILFGLTLLYVALSLTFRWASRTIVAQKLAVERTASELRQAYEELQQAQARLIQSEKLASAGRLAAGIVHEIGNPLASVQGLLDLQLLCRGRPEDRTECRDRSERIAGEISRLKQILRGLLDYGRPAPVELGPLDLNEAVETALGLVASQKEFERVTWIRDFDRSGPRVVADRHVLEQILINLLLNAAQATMDRGPIRVGTGMAPAGGWRAGAYRVGRAFAPGDAVAAIVIADHGPGIPAEDLERIFEPFFTTKRRDRGSGLGLAICHSLIEALHGALVVESRPGAGTTVRVLLPPAGSRNALAPVSAGEAEDGRRG